MHGRLAHGDEPLSYAQPQTFTLRGTDWPIRETLFLKAYFLVCKSTDMQSIQTPFRTELYHASFLKKASTFVAVCVSVPRSQARACSLQRHGVLLYRVTHKGFLIVFRMSRWARSKGEASTSSPRRHSLFLLGVTFVRLLRTPNRFGRLSLLELFFIVLF